MQQYQISGRVSATLRFAVVLFVSMFSLLSVSESAAHTLVYTWERNLDPEVAGYQVSYGFAPSQYTSTIDNAASTTFTLENLSPGVSVYFIVQARSTSGGLSTPSPEVSFFVSDPGMGASPTPSPTPTAAPAQAPTVPPTPTPAATGTVAPGPTGGAPRDDPPAPPDRDGDGLSDAQEAAAGTNPVLHDSDFDGRSDREELLIDGTNPLDGGHTRLLPGSSGCGTWARGHVKVSEKKRLSQILELRNSDTAARRTVSLEFSPDTGAPLLRDMLVLNPAQHFGWNLGELAERSAGRVCLLHEGLTDGAVVSYFEDLAPGARKSFQFAYATPLHDGRPGIQAVTFNTRRPSTLKQQQSYTLTNVLSVENTGTRRGNGTVQVYSAAGRLLKAQRISVEPRKRFDYELHRFGKNVVGTAVWSPEDRTQRFIVRNTRSFHDGTTTRASFLSEFRLEAKNPTGARQSVLLSTHAKGRGEIELVNVLSIPIRAVLRAFASDGSTMYSGNIVLPPKEVRILSSIDLLGATALGQVTLESDRPESLVAFSVQYGFDASGGLAFATGSTGTSPFGGALGASYNTFFEQENLVRVRNLSMVAQDLRVDVRSSEGELRAGDVPVHVPPNGISTFDVSDVVGRNDSGSITVRGAAPNTLAGEIERYRSNEFDILQPLHELPLENQTSFPPTGIQQSEQ